jgi:hypothetical protein
MNHGGQRAKLPLYIKTTEGEIIEFYKERKDRLVGYGWNKRISKKVYLISMLTDKINERIHLCNYNILTPIEFTKILLND